MSAAPDITLAPVDTAFVKSALKNPFCKVIDTRDSSTFIGWQLNGEKLKGHITGATDYSASWITFPYHNPWITDEAQRARFTQKLEEKDITPDKTLVLYDYTGKDAPIVADFLQKRGFTSLYYYDFHLWDGPTTWAPRYDKAVPVEWVKDLIDGKNPPFYDGGPYRIFDVSETDEPCREFIERHLPGATHISVNEFQDPATWSTVSDDKLEQFACNNGITADTTVVLYAEGYTGACHILASVLEYMGVRNVKCINGSNYQWLVKDYPTESGNPPKRPVPRFGVTVPQHPEYLVKLDEAKRISAGQKHDQLVDMRPWAQYTGETSGYSYFTGAGRIPNSTWCSDDYYYLNPDETVGNPEEMLEQWKEHDVDTSNRTVFYCGSGGW